MAHDATSHDLSHCVKVLSLLPYVSPIVPMEVLEEPRFHGHFFLELSVLKLVILFIVFNNINVGIV